MIFLINKMQIWHHCQSLIAQKHQKLFAESLRIIKDQIIFNKNIFSLSVPVDT